jgi:hypothetical protein
MSRTSMNVRTTAIQCRGEFVQLGSYRNSDCAVFDIEGRSDKVEFQRISPREVLRERDDAEV